MRDNHFFLPEKSGKLIISGILLLIAAIIQGGYLTVNILESCSGGVCIPVSHLILGAFPVVGCLFLCVFNFFIKNKNVNLTIAPVVLICTYLFVRMLDQGSVASWIQTLYCIITVGLALVYALVMTNTLYSKLPIAIGISLLLAYSLVYDIILGVIKLVNSDFSLLAIGDFVIPLAMPLMLIGVLFLLKPMIKKPIKNYRPRVGDRCDGRRIRTLNAMAAASPYIMVTRNTSSNFIKDTIEYDAVDAYIRRKRREGLENFGFMHVVAAVYVRVIAQRPALNRFVAGQKVYARHDIALNMVVKKEMNTTSPDTCIKVIFDPTDTADDVYRKFNEKVEEVKNAPLDSGFDNLAALLNAIPGLIKKATVWLLRTLDYFGMLPNVVLQLSPFHGSIFITSMGSLGIPPIYHHLYDFGTVPVFCSFGSKYKVNQIENDGSVTSKRCIDFTFVTDERVCDGFYFASCLKLVKRYMKNPEILDTPIEDVKTDIL